MGKKKAGERKAIARSFRLRRRNITLVEIKVAVEHSQDSLTKLWKEKNMWRKPTGSVETELELKLTFPRVYYWVFLSAILQIQSVDVRRSLILASILVPPRDLSMFCYDHQDDGI